MAIRNRMPPWHENFSLPNGRTLLLRPIRPEDGPPLQGAFSLLGPEEIRARFVRSSAEITPEMVQRLTHPNPKSEIVLVAAEQLPPGEALVGAVARAALVPGTRQAEYTILVSSFVAGQGLGRQLMRKTGEVGAPQIPRLPVRRRAAKQPADAAAGRIAGLQTAAPPGFPGTGAHGAGVGCLRGGDWGFGSWDSF